MLNSTQIDVHYGTSRLRKFDILGSNDEYNWTLYLNCTNKPHTDDVYTCI